MTKIFDLPYCINDLRYYLKPLSTTEELLRLKQYFYYQKNLAKRLIKYQRLLTSKYKQRFYPNQNLLKDFGLSSRHSNENIVPINSDLHQENINNRLECQTSVTSINQIKTPIIKLNTCSTIIATGHGIATRMSLLIDTSTEQLNDGIIDEEISLSKSCQKIFTRSLYAHQMNPK